MPDIAPDRLLGGDLLWKCVCCKAALCLFTLNAVTCAGVFFRDTRTLKLGSNKAGDNFWIEAANGSQ